MRPQHIQLHQATLRRRLHKEMTTTSRSRVLWSLVVCVFFLTIHAASPSSRLSSQENEAARAYFAAKDMDKDGKLNQKEFMKALEGTGLDPRHLPKDHLEDIKGYFGQDGSGKITWSQWKEIFDGEMPVIQSGGSNSKTASEGRRNANMEGGGEGGEGEQGDGEGKTWDELQFEKHDKNGDGKICRKEAHGLIAGEDHRPEHGGDAEVHASVDELFQELDRDLSESISLDEWLGEGLSSLYSGLLGNTHAFQQFENPYEDELGFEEEDLSFQ